MTPQPEPNQRCPNCADAPTRVVFAIDAAQRVVRCTGCGLEFAERFPDMAHQQEEIYPASYFERALARRAHRERIFGELVDQLGVLLGRTGRLLDVGAGEGTILRAARDRGWRVEGTEVSLAIIERLRAEDNLTIHCGELERLDLPRGAYDAIVMNHVLEHVRDPGAALRTARDLLAEGGVLRIEAPNHGSLTARYKAVVGRLGLSKSPWKHYSLGHHFWFFTAKTMARTLEAAGLRAFIVRAPAKQWGPKGALDRGRNAVWDALRLGGRLVAFARKA
jgi:2-polyprenyl-3-methyl-5-hydroxy-6-metoxy-1,4-benzoquinol methylase